MRQSDPQDSTGNRQRTALVAGGGGLLGRHMTKRLAGSGWQTHAFTHAELDITDAGAVRATAARVRPDLIINCVATADVDRCEREPDWAYAVNEQGARHLADAAHNAGAEIVHVSTDYVFDGAKAGFYTQDDEPRPLSVYGQSKLAGERAAGLACERCYVVRTSWLFGVGGKNFGSRVIEYARSMPRLKGVMDQTSIPTYAPDLARRIEEIVSTKTYGVYHGVNSGPATWLEFARLALELAGIDHVEIEPVTREALNQAAPRPHNSAMRCLLSERLGLAPLRDWRAAIVEFVRELQAAGGV
ncbi:MAG TPA: dTDP-4-dehydrorhamnose reductase [Blastocatellia bacterium]|nr:dTDP-4-dehydrorhamnose reductase [Blastocatellia bacterium]